MYNILTNRVRALKSTLPQDFFLRFCILQVIKNWRWGRPGNETTESPGLRLGCIWEQGCLLSVSISYQGAYIPPVLKESPPQLEQPRNSVGYQSFGSTDHMGRHCPSSAPPEIDVTPKQTINVEVQESEDPSSDSDTHPLINPTLQ